jgi:hypothetical protein
MYIPWILNFIYREETLTPLDIASLMDSKEDYSQFAALGVLFFLPH